MLAPALYKIYKTIVYFDWDLFKRFCDQVITANLLASIPIPAKPTVNGVTEIRWSYLMVTHLEEVLKTGAAKDGDTVMDSSMVENLVLADHLFGLLPYFIRDYIHDLVYRINAATKIAADDYQLKTMLIPLAALK